MVISVTAYQDDDGRLYKRRLDAATTNLVNDFETMRGTLTCGQEISLTQLATLARILANDMNKNGRRMLREALDRFEAESVP